MTVPKGKRPRDPNKLTAWIVEQSTGEVQSNPATPIPETLSAYMSAIGRKGGMAGGKRRLITMTPEQRRVAAQKAAKARWKKAAGKETE